MKDFRNEDTKDFRLFVRILFGIFSVATILLGLGILFDGWTQGVIVGQESDKTVMLLGFLITVLDLPFYTSCIG